MSPTKLPFQSLQFFSPVLKLVLFTLLDCYLDCSSWIFCLIAEKMIESRRNKICSGAEISRTQRYNFNSNGNIFILALHQKSVGMILDIKKNILATYLALPLETQK